MSSCIELEGVYYPTAQAWFRVLCIESSIKMKVCLCCVWIFFWVNDLRWLQQCIQTQRGVLGSQSGNLSSFEWCIAFMYEWPVLGQWPVPVQQINDLLCTPLISLWFWLFIHIFCLYSHNSVNFVIGISRMRLIKAVYKFHHKCLQKVFRKFLFWCLGWFSLKSLQVLWIFKTYFIIKDNDK